MNKQRRQLVVAMTTGVAAVPLSMLLLPRVAGAADMAKLDPENAAAKSLAYTHQSADADRQCSGCQFYTDPSASEWGPCIIFPGKLVSADGVCNSWRERAG